MKLVIIARHYPPAVSGGARRPYFLAHALKEAGAEIFLVAPDRDPALAGIAVTHPNRDPAPDGGGGRVSALEFARNTAREWVRWPDPDITWSQRAARAALASLLFKPDWVLTTSPPESIHWAGKKLKAATGARWCADFRDQWFERAFRVNRRKPVRRHLETLYARQLLRDVDLTVSVNELIDGEVASLAGLRAAQREIIGHFSAPRSSDYQFEGPGPHLLHTGSFSLSDPDCPIAPTLQAFETAAQRAPSLRLHLAGRLSQSELKTVAASPAAGQIVIHGTVPLVTSLAMQAAADALIVAAAPQAPVPPGKYAEYRAAGRPVIATGDGPWRERIGLAAQDAAHAMMDPEALALPDGMMAGQSAAEAARQLLDAMQRATDRTA